MRLSIVDQAPISANQTAYDAFNESLRLAQLGESLGYTRYWIAEHHDLQGLACSAPEVMLSYIGAQTKKIRIGSGAILLPHYRPYKVAEVFHMLATLFPNRIDLGIGRAPGGSAEATNALSENFLQKVYQFPSLVNELLMFLENDFPEDHEYANITASPYPEHPPIPWLLGTSKKSALLAAQFGLPYVFGHFMSNEDGVAIVQKYVEKFQPRKNDEGPQVIVTVNVFCGETTEEAEKIALSSLIWSIQKEKGERERGIPSIEEAKRYVLTEKEQQALEKRKQKMIIGNPKEVKQKLIELKETYKADEIMINTITYLPDDRMKSYERIANELIK